MKKNMLSVLILALLIVNIVLTAVMMFSVTSASRKTAALVTDISSALNLELGGTQEEEEVVEAVPMADIETYEIADLTAMLKNSDDGKSHYAQVSVTLSMNTKNKDYKTYSDLSTKENLIKSEILEAFSEYTMDDAKDDTQGLKNEILQRIQGLFGSDFIFDVNFSSILYQ